ncbi:hypothetical protein EV127DRAFT_478668 [Xylaria flabelliformis]|nr:hypothetical protein EV127DRAFT_478668 [Xylaria flabelliformis]
MSLYHDYLRDATANADHHEGPVESYKPSLPVFVFRPLTPCFDELAVPRGHEHTDDDFEDYTHRTYGLHVLAQKDIIAASIKICMLETERCADPIFKTRVQEDAFIALLIACADGDMVEVKALNGILETLSGASALTTPLLLQILVAVALSHYNNKLISDLVTWSSPPRCNLFNLSSGSSRTWLWDYWSHSGHTDGKSLSAWEALFQAEWVAPRGGMMDFVYQAQDTAEEVSHAIYIFEQVLQSKAGLPASILSTIEKTVQQGSPAVVAHMLTRLPHQKIKPRPHFLLTDAAGRSAVGLFVGRNPRAAEMLEALRPMKLNVNSIVDPRYKAPRTQTPLHIATWRGNTAAVEWCLRNGARPTKNWCGKYQWETAGKSERILALYQSEGWEIDNKAWLMELERVNSDIRDEGGFLCGLRRVARKLSLSSAKLTLEPPGAVTTTAKS